MPSKKKGGGRKKHRRPEMKLQVHFTATLDTSPVRQRSRCDRGGRPAPVPLSPPSCRGWLTQGLCPFHLFVHVCTVRRLGLTREHLADRLLRGRRGRHPGGVLRRLAASPAAQVAQERVLSAERLTAISETRLPGGAARMKPTSWSRRSPQRLLRPGPTDFYRSRSYHAGHTSSCPL